MKKILILALILLLGCAPAMAGCGSSQDTPPSKEAKKYPEITFDYNDYVGRIGIGKIERGKAVSHTFKFRNTGRVPLVILDVAVSCGCTTSQYTKEPVLPGRYGEVTITFDGEGFGRFTKSATLTLNTRKGREVLYITGEIKN